MKNKRGQGITHVGSLFEKYSKVLRAPQSTVIVASIAVIEGVCGHTLATRECRYNTYTQTLTVTASGMIKTEILLHKKTILKNLREVLGEKSAPKDIT